MYEMTLLRDILKLSTKDTHQSYVKEYNTVMCMLAWWELDLWEISLLRELC